MRRFPDYPRDPDDDIPEEMCLDVVRVWAEWGGAYLWDMNGCSCGVADITGKTSEALDAEFEEWQSIYEGNKMDDKYDPIWNSDFKRLEFDRKGIDLSRRLFEYLQGAKTVIYFDTENKITRFDSELKPGIRLNDN